MKKVNLLFVLCLVFCFVCITGCDMNNTVVDSETIYSGSISGKAYFSNAEDSSSIQITLEKNDGLRTAKVLKSCGTIDDSISNSRNVVSYTACAKDGSYSFENLEPGVYTVYAMAKDSSEKAVSRNISIVEDGVTLVPDLQLTAIGNLRGNISIDDSSDKNSGFVIFIAGTSYMAITGKDGNFVISDVPAGSDYEIIIMYGTYTYYWKENIEVKPFETVNIGTKNFSKYDIQDIKNELKGKDGKDGTDGKNGTSIVWKGSFESSEEIENPRYLWAYYNTTDGCSYIFDGKDWGLLSGKGSAGISAITTINYELNGGSFSTDPVLSVTYGNTISLSIPSKTNCTFMGWYLHDNFEGDEIKIVKCDGTQSQVSVYALWKEETVLTIDSLGNYISSLESRTDPYYIILDGNFEFATLKNLLKKAKSGVYIALEILDEITSIGDNALSECNSLYELIIPNTVTSIGKEAFAFCENLTAINIPEKITSIPYRAYCYCTSLKQITIPETVESIAEEAFYYCTSVEIIRIPASVKSINSTAFNDCWSLGSITVDGKNTVYNSGYGCNAIIETATNTLFIGCNNTIIPNNITKIGKYAFRGCRGLKKIDIPYSVTIIDDGAFDRCINLEEISVLQNVTYIGNFVFERCESLKEVLCTNSTEFVGRFAFYYCTNLKKLYLGSNDFYKTQDEDDWKAKKNGINVDLSDMKAAASHFIDENNYYSYYWYK